MLLPSLVLFSGLTASSRAADVATFDAAVASAVATSPAVQAARADLMATTAIRRAYVARGRPQVRIAIQASKDLDSDRFGPRLRDQSSLTLGFNLYSGGRVRNSIAAGRMRADAAAAELQASVDDLRIAVAQRYDQYLDASDGVAIEADQVRLLSEQSRAVAAEREAGVATRTDAATTAARGAVARARLATAEGDREEAAARYAAIVGSPVPATLAEPALPAVAADLDVLVADALRYSPSLKALAARVAAAIRDEQAARGLSRPTLSVNASANYGNTDLRLAQIGRFPHRASVRATISLTVPIYVGGQASAQVARQRAAADRARAEAEAGRRSIVAEVTEDYAAYRGAVARMAAADETLAANRQALAGVRIERASGTRLPIDVLNAEREVRDSARSVVRTRRLAHYHAYALMVRTGAVGTPPAPLPAAAPVASAPIAPLRFDLAGLAGSRREPPSPRPARSAGPVLAVALDGLG